MLPEDVAAAAREALARANIKSPRAEVRAAPGEIALARGLREPLARLVVVQKRHDDTRTVWVQLITNVINSATDLDAIVRAGEAGVPFDFVVEAELYGPLFIEQLESSLGTLPEPVRAATAVALTTDGDSLAGFETGLPLGDMSDPRRAFKEQELDELESLVSECRIWLAGERTERPELILAEGTHFQGTHDVELQEGTVRRFQPLQRRQESVSELADAAAGAGHFAKDDFTCPDAEVRFFVWGEELRVRVKPESPDVRRIELHFVLTAEGLAAFECPHATGARCGAFVERSEEYGFETIVARRRSDRQIPTELRLVESVELSAT